MQSITPRQGAMLLTLVKGRALAKHKETAVHAAADAYLQPMTIAVWYALLKARRAYKSGGAKAAVKAVRAGLLKTLPAVLEKTAIAGGNAALGMLPKLKAAGDSPGHGNQYSDPALQEAHDRGFDHGKTGYGFQKQVAGRKGSAKHEAYRKGYDAGVDVGMDWRHANSLRTLKPSGKTSLDMRFDAPNSDAAKWAQEHAAELANDISATTEQIIKDAVAAAHEAGDLSDTYDSILDAIGDEDRAQLIARTEIMTAANEGQQMGWEQATEAGLLPEDATVAWIATDSGACPECEALDGTTRDLNGSYDDPDAADGPPLHPNCRCTEGIVGF